MPITINHTIVPAHDKTASAAFFARIFALPLVEPTNHFAPVRVNDTFTMDFDNIEKFEKHHYAFMVTEEEFDEIFGRIKAEGLVYGSLPGSQDDMKINDRRGRGGRGVYFKDPNGHSLELMTK